MHALLHAKRETSDDILPEQPVADASLDLALASLEISTLLLIAFLFLPYFHFISPASITETGRLPVS